MPELPEVETTVNGIRNFITGSKIQNIVIRRPNLRWSIPKSALMALVGLPILSVQRRAKYLLLNTKKGVILWHLGMSGSLRITDKTHPAEKHEHIDIIFENTHILRYKDPRRFGYCLWSPLSIEKIHEHPLLQHLGEEPLHDTFCAPYLHAKTQQTKRPIKVTLMDAKIVVGVGNIYANEALFAAKIHPKRPSNKLSIDECASLVTCIKNILTQSIKIGGTTLKDFQNPKGNPGYFQQQLQVYAQINCSICKGIISTIPIQQRNSFFCAQCQK